MPFDETHTAKLQTAHDHAVEAEKWRKVKEHQRPFIAAPLARLGEVATDEPAYVRRGGCPPCRVGSSKLMSPRSFGGSTLPPPMTPTSSPTLVPTEPPVPNNPPPSGSVGLCGGDATRRPLEHQPASSSVPSV